MYEGRPNHENNAAWENLLSGKQIFIYCIDSSANKSVGVVTISSEENARLTNGSALVEGSSDTYMVELEMFHQFHCLVRSFFSNCDVPC